MTQLKDNMSNIKDQIITLVKQRHHSHKAALEQEKDSRSKHAIDLIARIREDSRLIEVIDSLPEEKPSEDLEEAAKEFARLYDQGTCDGIAQDCFKAGAKWKESQMPMSEDTVIFQKGVAEGRRLEKDDLALTWEDVYQIIMINSQMEVSGDFDISQWEDYAEEHCKEVLKRFKNLKSK